MLNPQEAQKGLLREEITTALEKIRFAGKLLYPISLEFLSERSKVLFFTIEMKRTTLVKRILSAEETIKSYLFRHCQFSETEWAHNTKTAEKIQPIT